MCCMELRYGIILRHTKGCILLRVVLNWDMELYWDILKVAFCYVLYCIEICNYIETYTKGCILLCVVLNWDMELYWHIY